MGLICRSPKTRSHASGNRRSIRRPFLAIYLTTPPWRPLKDPSRIWLNADKLPFPRYAPDMEGTFIANQAARFLDEHRSQDQPFALWVSFMEPHSPFRFPVEGRTWFQTTDFAVPPLGPEDAAQIPLVFRDLTEDDKRAIIAAYYTSVRFLDSEIGAVLQHLSKLGLDENTVVVYTADHGYMLGQHGRFEKHCGYDPALRVPLSVRYPGRYSPRVVRDLTEHVDLTSTILDILEAPPLTVQHGRSLRPYLERGKHTKPRDHIFSEYLENEEAYIRTHNHKFIYCTGRRARTEGYITDNPTPGRYVRLYDSARILANFTTCRERTQARHRLQIAPARRFRNTHPNAAAEPRDVNSDQILDWYLRPPDA